MDDRKRTLSAITLCVLAISSCAAPREPVNPPHPRTLGREFPSDQIAAPAPTGAAPAALEDPTGVIALRDALALALIHNPKLAAFSWEVRAREASALQAGLLPNPEITIELENFGGSGSTSGFDASENTLWLSQLVELGGKRTKRRTLAEFERDIAGWDYEAARIDTLTDVTLAFVDVLTAQERKALSQELVGVGERALKIVDEQINAGAVSSVEISRAEVVLASHRVALTRRVHELASARKRLAATWGSTTVAFSEVAGALEERVESPPAEQVLLHQVEENPDLARWVAKLAASRAAVALEDSRRIPNVTVGGGPRWNNETDNNSFVFELNVPLPLFDRNQGAVLEARRRLAKASEERRAAEVNVRTDLSTAYQSLAATHETLVTLRNQVLPKAQAAFDGVNSGYRRGVFQYLDVLDAQRTLYALRSEYLDSLAAYHAAVARVERLVGRPLNATGDEEGKS